MSDSSSMPEEHAEPQPESGGIPADAAALELPPQSVSTMSICVRGGCFATNEEAKAFANTLAAVICEISRYIDMKTLDGVTVGVDYAQALAELDRGRAGLRPLDPFDGGE